MSRRPIARSPDLLRLQNEGYNLEIRGGLLLVKSVPYIDSNRAIRRDGTLVVRLDLSGDKTNPPSTHVAYWSGEHPCHSDGSRIGAFQNPSPPQDMGHGVRADFTFSAKAEYRDYHHQVTTYIGRIVGEACKIEPKATACIFAPIPTDNGESVLKYVDTASSRAGIDTVNERTIGKRIGIVGGGGTGAYILDFVAKTWVAEIHLFDGDVFSQHNAFRTPGAPSLPQLEARPQKVAYLKAIYENMRNGIVAHDGYLEGDNLALLDGLDFVFLCLDRGAVKRPIIEQLIANGTPFVEVGMGVVLTDGQLSGIVRTVTSTRETRAEAAPHVSYAAEDGVANEYATNIQIAELNAINAAIAVVQWKKLLGIYQDTRGQYYTGYSVPSGEIIAEGKK
jgi:hypothetical protein